MSEYLAAVGLGANTLPGGTQTFTDVPLGTPAANREIVVALFIYASGSSIAATCSIAGVTATLIGDGTYAGGAVRIMFWRAAIPDGIDGDIVIANTGSNYWFLHDVGVWAVNGIEAITTATGTTSTTITGVAGGVIIAAAGYRNSTGTYEWTNAAEDFELAHAAASRFTGARSTTVGATTITAIRNGTNSDGILAVALALADPSPLSYALGANPVTLALGANPVTGVIGAEPV